MKIKQKLIDTKNSVVNFGKEHNDGIIITVLAAANVAVIACIGNAIIGAKRDFIIDKENGFTEIGDKIYKLAEDGDFITVDQWNEHTK